MLASPRRPRLAAGTLLIALAALCAAPSASSMRRAGASPDELDRQRPGETSSRRRTDQARPRHETPGIAPRPATGEARDAAARTDGAVQAIASHETGERLFRDESFGGNGRTCAACHAPADSFGITPARVRDLFRDNRDGPLFQDRDSDAGDGARWSILRRFALFSVEVPLHERVAVEGDPLARSILVRRAVPSLANVALSAPYGWDGGVNSLEERSLVCADQHLLPGRPLERRERQALALFQELLIYPARLQSWTPPRVVPPSPGPSLPMPAAAARRGQDLFAATCASCHGGELLHRQPGSDGSPLYASVGISEKNVNDLPVHRLVFTRDDGSTTTVTTPDPGLAALTGRLQDLNRFEVPALRGVVHSAPYFHDHSAADLDAVIDHYESLLAPEWTAGERDDLRAYLESL